MRKIITRPSPAAIEVATRSFPLKPGRPPGRPSVDRQRHLRSLGDEPCRRGADRRERQRQPALQMRPVRLRKAGLVGIPVGFGGVLAISRLSHRVITWRAGTVQDFYGHPEPTGTGGWLAVC